MEYVPSTSIIHEITPGSIVDYYGTPAIKSTKRKHDPNLPIKHWWITAPVAEAIVVAEQLSTRHDRLFPPLHRHHAAVARSGQMLDAFTAHINTTSARTGLQRIPPGNVRPHMFRRTMAMLTDQFPGSEIALGIQLKHIASRALANHSTQGYANADSSWAAHSRVRDRSSPVPTTRGPLQRPQDQEANRIRPRRRADVAHLQRHSAQSLSSRWRRDRRTSPAPKGSHLHPFRRPQPLCHGREQPSRRGLPRTRHRARRSQGTATRSVPSRPMYQQCYRP